MEQIETLIDEAKKLRENCKKTCPFPYKDCILHGEAVFCSDCESDGTGCHPSPHGYICMAFKCVHEKPMEFVE